MAGSAMPTTVASRAAMPEPSTVAATTHRPGALDSRRAGLATFTGKPVVPHDGPHGPEVVLGRAPSPGTCPRTRAPQASGTHGRLAGRLGYHLRAPPPAARGPRPARPAGLAGSSRH